MKGGACAPIWSFFGTAGAKNQEGAVSSTKKLTQVAHNLFVELPYLGGSAGFGTFQQRFNCSGFFFSSAVKLVYLDKSCWLLFPKDKSYSKKFQSSLLLFC